MFKIIAFVIIMLLVQLCVRHFAHIQKTLAWPHIISKRGEVWAYKTNLTQSEVSVPSQGPEKRVVMYLCVRDIDFASTCIYDFHIGVRKYSDRVVFFAVFFPLCFIAQEKKMEIENRYTYLSCRVPQSNLSRLFIHYYIRRVIIEDCGYIFRRESICCIWY
jgi:hypothetical protein